MKVGDYVRTVGGFIGKVISKKGSCTTYRIPNMQEDDVLEIIKSSPSIMDLIEENDYIRTINDTDFRRVYMSYGKLVIEKHGLELSIKKLKLSEIITSQQFPQMKYKVESEVN